MVLCKIIFIFLMISLIAAIAENTVNQGVSEDGKRLAGAKCVALGIRG